MKVLGILCACLAFVSNGFAFSLLGPYKAWMTEALAYRQPGDLGGPMNLGEGYRWNLPTITYGFDQSFLDYFGEEGVRAVEEAFAVLNDLPPMSEIDVNAYPTDSTSFNLEAQVLGLRDLKSQTLVILLNQLGLTEPTRFTYAIRARQSSASGTDYVVIRLNFDPVTWIPAMNVNDVEYVYQIVDNAHGADAWEVQVDPLDVGYNAVADRTLWLGGFYTGLTRDDVGGLRFLLRTNNVTVERLPAPVSLAPAQTNAGTSASLWWPGPPKPITNVIDTAPRPGIDKLNFVRLSWESNRQQFVVLTNVFVDTYFTNAQRRQQSLQRVVTRPDILFRAHDLRGEFHYVSYEPGKYSYAFMPRLFVQSDTSRWISHDDINGLTQIGGPGVIPPGATIDFGTPGRYVGLGNPNVIGQIDQWGVFNGSTNPPVALLGPERASSVTISSRIYNQDGASVFEWTVLGIHEAVYRIERTTNLVDWTPVTTITNVDGHFAFSEAVTSPRRFYRAVRE